MRLLLMFVAAMLFANFSVSAAALNTRTWISGNGTDVAGCGPVSSPCRTLQYAHDNTASGGEIDVKDSAGYGSVVITKSIAIIGDGSISGVLAAATQTAITISAASSDTVILRGLTIEGANVAYNGIAFNSGAMLDIANCVSQNFVSNGNSSNGNGIVIRPSSGTSRISITNTTASHNDSDGISYSPQTNSTATVHLAMDHVTVVRNYGNGIDVYGGPSSGDTNVALTNSFLAFNQNHGVSISGSRTSGTIDLITSDRNTGSGIYVSSGTVTIGRSLSAGNGAYGLVNGGGTVSSFKDNRFTGNTSLPSYGTIGTAALN